MGVNTRTIGVGSERAAQPSVASEGYRRAWVHCYHTRTGIGFPEFDRSHEETPAWAMTPIDLGAVITARRSSSVIALAISHFMTCPCPDGWPLQARLARRTWAGVRRPL